MTAIPKTARQEDKLLREYLKRLPCFACRKVGTEFNPIDPSHVLTRGAGRPDAWFNIVSHCRECHRAFEDNRLGFIEAHPRFWARLQAMGWRIEHFVGRPRLWHPYLEKESEEDGIPN